MKKLILLFAAITLSVSIFAQDVISYKEFQKRYKPHNNLINPENVVVPVMSKMEAKAVAPIFDEFVKSDKEDSKTTFVLLLTSMPREKVGKALDLMKKEYLVKGINYLKDEWALDIIYYISETTYNSSASGFNAIKNYGGGKKSESVSLTSSNSTSSSEITLSSIYQLGWFVSGSILSQGQNIQVQGFLNESISKLGIANMESYGNDEVNKMANKVLDKYGEKAGNAFRLGAMSVLMSALEGKTLRNSFKKFKGDYIAIFGEDDYISNLSKKVKREEYSKDANKIMTEIDAKLLEIPVESPANKLSLSNPYQLGWFVMGSIISKGENVQVAGFLEKSVEELEIETMESFEPTEINSMNDKILKKHGALASNAFQLGAISGTFGTLEGRQFRDSFKKFKSYYIAIFGEDEYLKTLSQKVKDKEVIKNTEVMGELDQRLTLISLK